MAARRLRLPLALAAASFELKDRRPAAAEGASQLQVHVLMGGFGGGRLAGWSRATPADQKELLQRLRPEVRCTFGPEAPAGTQILVAAFPSEKDLNACGDLKALIIPFAGMPVATKKVLSNGGWIARGVQVHNVHHNSSTTAEMAIALGLAAAKQLLPADRSLRKGDWSPRGLPSDGELDPMFQLGLDGQTALVLGYGEVGRRVCKVLAAMNMRVIATRKTAPASAELPEAGSIAVRQAAELRTLLPKAQLLFICLPHTAETEALIGERELSLLPENAVIVNVGRADVIEEKAFYHALKEKRLLGAGVDCWYQYPADFQSRSCTPVSKSFNFAGLESLVMSPHRAGSVGLAATERERMAALAELFNCAAAEGFAAMPNRSDLSKGY